MEFILKLKTKFNMIYNINNLKRKIDKDCFQTLKLNICNNESFIINVEPIVLKNKLLFPYNVYVSCNNGKLDFESANIEVLNYKNTYVITFLCVEAVKDMKVMLSENNFSVFNTYCTNITSTGGTIKLPNLYEKVNLEKFNNYNILTFDEESKFAVIILNGEIIFSDYYSKIKKDSKNINILTDLNDIAKHCKLTTIEGSNKTEKFVYKYSEPKLTRCNKIIPLALLQALKVKNEKLCKHYLNGNLKDIASIESLNSFFGDFKKTELDGDNIVLFYKDGENYYHKTFNFKLQDNKIYHIDVF